MKALQPIVETLWRDIDVPHGLHEEVRLFEPRCAEWFDGYEFTACRRNGRHYTWYAAEHLHITRALYDGRRGVLKAVLEVLHRLADGLRFRIPPGWRLYNRPKAPPTLRTRLRHAC